MDDEQRERLADLRRTASRGVAWTAALAVFVVVVALVSGRAWTESLWGPAGLLLLNAFYVISNYRYIKRGPFPRMPDLRRDPPWPEDKRED
ncbi:hypothetical protein ACOBQX_16355 [Actinokineospora sp. G85]|uniref:hypothetical protein n=1 Tax=Actinokineospora sp. G85 TaxID=3406626 RepID=UPI003C7930A2